MIVVFPDHTHLLFLKRSTFYLNYIYYCTHCHLIAIRDLKSGFMLIVGLARALRTYHICII